MPKVELEIEKALQLGNKSITLRVSGGRVKIGKGGLRWFRKKARLPTGHIKWGKFIELLDPKKKASKKKTTKNKAVRKKKAS